MARGRHPHAFARAGGRAVADALRKAQQQAAALPPKRPAVTRSRRGKGPGRVVGRSRVLRSARRLGGALPRVVCAWCKPQRIIRQGKLPATHGICEKCRAEYFGGERDNPPVEPIQVRQFRSARGHLVSGDVDAISYVHIDSTSLRPYRHVFKGTGTELWALADGSLLVRNPNARLWADIVVEDDA